jgi:hypothetical protein
MPNSGRPSAVLGLAVLLLPACGVGDTRSLPADPRVILEAHISHGIGDSPFDSPLVHDSIAAEMIVRARECAPTDGLRALHPDSAEGVRLLERLQSDRLVVMRGDRACTTFPVLLTDVRARYATITSDVAEEAARQFAEDLTAVTRMVQELGWIEWQYHVVWSQLFDSQFAWTEMMQRGLVPPLGRLIAWVVYPAHALRSGTNYYPDTELGDHWLMVTWRADAANTVGLVGSSWEAIYQAALGRATPTTAERASLAELGLLDSTGRLQVPVLRNGDALHGILQALAGRYIAFLEQRMPLEELVALSGVDRQHAFAMAYHDISWGVIDRLIRSGRIVVPPALEPGTRETQPSMRGVTAITPVYSPFADLIRAALEAR